MRDIKFRGKYLDDTSEWLYGNYVYIEDDVFHHKIADKSGLLLDIDINTIGQYTGLKDKNGKEIYEGDIVKAIFADEEEPEMKGTVIYVEAGACYMVIANNGDEWDLGYLDKIEKIGNKWDNPELLEEGE